MKNETSPNGAKLAGFCLVMASVWLSPRAVGSLLASDGVIEGGFARATIMGGQLVLFAAGVWFFFAGRGAGARLRNVALGLGIAGMLAGGYGMWRAVPGEGAAGPERVLSLQEVCDWVSLEDPNIGTGNLLKYGKRLEQALLHPADQAALGDAHESMAEIQLRHGQNAEGVANFEEAYALAQAAERTPEVLQRLRRSLGVAQMRLGETSHCIAMHNPESCLFPIQAGGVWQDPSGAVAAAGYFLEYLEHEPGGLDVRWLLNIANQVAGTYPDGVPSEYLIPLSIFESEEPIGRFREIAGELGVDNFSMCGGAIMEDFDGDGFLDLFSSSMDFCMPVHYYHNQGDGTFEDWSERCGLGEQLGGFNCVQGDVDGDGLLDILILRGAWQGRKFGAQRSSLLRQRADGSFQDVTAIAGLADVAYPGQVGVFGDYDLDGDLDIFIGTEFAPCQLCTNDGSGRFTDRAAEAGVLGDQNCAVKSASWGDFDNDGDPDLYVSNYGKPNRLYVNDGQGGFVDRAAALGVDALDRDLESEPGDEDARELGRVAILGRDFTRTNTKDQTFVSWFWDMDNDGWLDLFVGGYGASLADIAGSYIGAPVAVRRHLRVFRNDGHGGFVNVSREMNVDDVHLPMGANYGDLNNDGYQDFYLGTGRPGFEMLIPNAMYLNQAGERFADVTAAAGVGHLQKGHGVAMGDLDNDGDLDIFAQMGGFFYGDAFRDALFENPGNDNHWVTLQLRGTQSNGFGIGARLKLVLQTPSGTREVHLLAGSGASFGGSSLQQEVGLGAASAIQSLEVRWPGGSTQEFTALPIDRTLRLTEGSAAFELIR